MYLSMPTHMITCTLTVLCNFVFIHVDVIVDKNLYYITLTILCIVLLMYIASDVEY